MEKEARHLISDRYRRSRQRLLLLDYDGTLVPFARFPDEAVPGADLLDLLQQLCRRARVYIISGRGQAFLEQWLGHLPLGLVAEHGAMIRHAKGNWIGQEQDRAAWKEMIGPLMQEYSISFPGSFVEEKKFSLAWHYRNVNEAIAVRASARLFQLLTNSAKLHGYEVLNGNKVIEVRCAGINKGNAARAIADQEDYDFILAAGDDHTDEDIFRALTGCTHSFSIKVGADSMITTAADFTLPALQDFLDLLKCFRHGHHDLKQ